jgi:NADH:quinone reductase (non-electrogenic)
MATSSEVRHIVVVGGGFGGVAVTRHLERMCRYRPDLRVTLVSRENFFVITPLLFEACSGRLELRHCAQPIRPVLRRARYIEAAVDDLDVDRRLVRATARDGATYELPYDQLIVALGASTNETTIPGSPSAFTFKTMADALLLRNHIIEQFERADATTDAEYRQWCLTLVVIGGGLVGVELIGELTAFAEDVLRYYPRIQRTEMRCYLFEAGPRILPEIDSELAVVAANVLRERGVDIRVGAPVHGIESMRVNLADEAIDAGTIVLAAGITPNAQAARMRVTHDRKGRVTVDATMRSVSDPNVWALGDCASIPSPDGHPYPALAQHAIREGKRVAKNVMAAIDRRPTTPFTYSSRGTLASLGHTRAVARIFGVPVTGFPAWWFRRTYYLLQMPRWDRRLRIVLDWTIGLFFRPDITKVELASEQEQVLATTMAEPPERLRPTG